VSGCPKTSPTVKAEEGVSMLHEYEEEDILNEAICGPNENIMSPALFIKSALLMKFRT